MTLTIPFREFFRQEPDTRFLKSAWSAAEYSFKIMQWTAFVAIVRYAADKSGSQLLFFLWLYLFLNVVAVIYHIPASMIDFLQQNVNSRFSRILRRIVSAVLAIGVAELAQFALMHVLQEFIHATHM